MKKLFAIVVILGSMGIAQAQEFDFGLKAGANFSDLSDADNIDNRTGILAGAFVALKFNDNWAIQPELLYSQQGGDSDFGDIHVDYVNVPVILKYYLIGGLNLQVGPQFGFVVNDDFPAADDIESQIEANDFDMSAALGVGYDLPFGLRVDARYNLGLNDTFDGVDGKNKVISLALGYSFF